VLWLITVPRFLI